MRGASLLCAVFSALALPAPSCGCRSGSTTAAVPIIAVRCADAACCHYSVVDASTGAELFTSVGALALRVGASWATEANGGLVRLGDGAAAPTAAADATEARFSGADDAFGSFEAFNLSFALRDAPTVAALVLTAKASPPPHRAHPISRAKRRVVVARGSWRSEVRTASQNRPSFIADRDICRRATRFRLVSTQYTCRPGNPSVSRTRRRARSCSRARSPSGSTSRRPATATTWCVVVRRGAMRKRGGADAREQSVVLCVSAGWRAQSALACTLGRREQSRLCAAVASIGDPRGFSCPFLFRPRVVPLGDGKRD